MIRVSPAPCLQSQWLHIVKCHHIPIVTRPLIGQNNKQRLLIGWCRVAVRQHYSGHQRGIKWMMRGKVKWAPLARWMVGDQLESQLLFSWTLTIGINLFSDFTESYFSCWSHLFCVFRLHRFRNNNCLSCRIQRDSETKMVTESPEK